jgi:hypothetical protein
MYIKLDKEEYTLGGSGYSKTKTKLDTDEDAGVNNYPERKKNVDLAFVAPMVHDFWAADKTTCTTS